MWITKRYGIGTGTLLYKWSFVSVANCTDICEKKKKYLLTLILREINFD